MSTAKERISLSVSGFRDKDNFGVFERDSKWSPNGKTLVSRHAYSFADHIIAYDSISDTISLDESLHRIYDSGHTHINK